MIEVIDLEKSYGDQHVLDHISLTLTDGNLYALVGRNGMGKTTLLTSIVKASFKDSGLVHIDGLPHHDMQARKNLFYVPDHPDMFLNLTGEEYLKCIAKLYDQTKEQIVPKIKELAQVFHMEYRLYDCIETYSLGMKQKIYIMAALLSDANNLILDEPFNGLDPESSAILKRLLIRYRDQGKMILFSIHNLDLVANFCDQILFLNKNGQISITQNTNNFEQLEQLFFETCVE